jgi:cardiolipin synthase A/B
MKVTKPGVCKGTPKEFFKRLSAGGVQVLEFNPINPLAGNKKGVAAQ